MRRETGGGKKGERRLWEEDMSIDFSFFLLLSVSGRLKTGRESRRIEAVAPKKVPPPPPPCWIVCSLFASLF